MCCGTTNLPGASAPGRARCSESCDRAVASGATAELRRVGPTVAGQCSWPRFGSNNDTLTPHHKHQGPFDHVEVEFQNAVLTKDQFGHRDKRELGALAEDRTSRSEEKVFYQLLRKGGPSANGAGFHILFSCDLDRVPIESVMLVEARVLRGDDSMLEVGRDLAQRNEFVSFVIRLVVNPGL